jgi:catechol 2,3-dioxygenase-like lactoylglutathione lyase family enzyme
VTEPIPFPDGARVAQVRIARPTDRLAAVVAFYRDGLGLPQLTSFKDHAGYDGVMLGLPGRSYHLEFTQHAHGSPCPAPSKDNLLVLYFPDESDLARVEGRLQALGGAAVPPENPYWLGKSVTYEDPDGWRVVLMHGSGI